MHRYPVDVSMLEQLMEWPDVMEIVVMVNKLLKVGMRGHMGCGGLSRSRCLSASSRLRAKTERATMRGPSEPPSTK